MKAYITDPLLKVTSNKLLGKMPYFRTPFIKGAHWVQADMEDPVCVVTVSEVGYNCGVVRFSFGKNGEETLHRFSCGEDVDSCEEGRLWLDWRVLEKVYCKHKTLYMLYIHIYVIYYYNIYNFYANEFLRLFN